MARRAGSRVRRPHGGERGAGEVLGLSVGKKFLMRQFVALFGAMLIVAGAALISALLTRRRSPAAAR